MDGMNAGLGSIASGVGTPGGTARVPEGQMGASRQSMEQMLEAARRMSDSQLADILSGKSMEVPQFVAMSEAMGRKELRTAMQGQQAQQQGQQPTIREQLLAETAAQTAPAPQATLPEEMGIGALPAPNMEQIDSMANGGIVAFDDGGLTKGEQDRLDFLRPFAATGDILSLPASYPMSVLSGARIPFTDTKLPEFYTQGVTPFYDMIRRSQAQAAAAQAEDYEALDQALNEQPYPVGETVDTTSEKPATKSGVSTTTGAPAAAAASTRQAPVQEARSPFAEFAEAGSGLERTLAEQQDQAQGEFLLQLGASLLTSPTIAEGLGKGAQTALPMLAANKREANKLRQDARDFKFNVAKAQEAAELGNQELAYKYEKLAADTAYQTGLLATKGTTGGITSKDLFTAFNNQKKEILKDPLTSSRYNKMSEAEKAAFDQKILQDLQRSYATIMGGGAMMQTMPASVQAAVDAEYNKRFGSE